MTTLGDLQLAIMRVIWERGEATATEVHTVLEPERGLAPTTIATMLRKLEDKGVVAHRAVGRVFVYRAAVGERDVHRSMVGELVERVFDGDPGALVSHLLNEGQVDLSELDALRRKIAAHQRKRRKGSRG